MHRLKKPLLILSAILGGFLALLLAASLLLASKAKTLAVDQINQYLSVPVNVKDIDFSLIRNFPYASIRFLEVNSKGSATKGDLSPLANAEEIRLLYNIMDFFSDELHLEKIIIKNAEFYFYTDAEGNINYDIFKEQSNSNSSTNVTLEQVELNQVKISYVDLPDKRDFHLIAENTQLTGAFTNDIYDLTIKGPLKVERIRIDDVNYLSNKETQADVVLNINTTTKVYSISNSSVQIADMQFLINGSIRDAEEISHLDISINSKEAGIRELLSLIPGVYTEGLNKYKYDGLVEFSMRIKGASGKKLSPLVTASFKANNAKLTAKDEDVSLKAIYLNGNYTSRISDRRPVSRLSLTNLRAKMEGQPIQGSLVIEDFKDPFIDLQLNSNIQLEVLSRFYMPDTIQEMKGVIAVNAHLKGQSKDRDSWISEGTLEASDVYIAIKNRRQAFNSINGKITLQGSSLLVNNLKVQAGGSDFTFNGNFDNAYGYVLSKSEFLNGDLSVNCANIDLNELLEDGNSTATDTIYRFDPDPRIHVNVSGKIGMIRFRKFEASDVSGRLMIDGKMISAENINFRGFEGSTTLSGQLNATSRDSMTISCEADMKRLDINTLFQQMGNFGQDVIIAENVSGKLTATIRFASSWSKDLHCNMDRIIAQSNLVIENGELKNFKPMLALNKYIKGADFQQIKFNTLKNQIDIHNQTITIPAMKIQSSALDLTASGTHTFNNTVDYKLQLYLSQLLGKRVRDQNTEFGTIEDDGLGRMKIFLSMKGSMSNPKVTFDKLGVEQKVTQDIKKEKEEFRNIIRKEFGIGKKDTITVKTPARKQELELDTE
jgi:hypothetical protein